MIWLHLLLSVAFLGLQLLDLPRWLDVSPRGAGFAVGGGVLGLLLYYPFLSRRRNWARVALFFCSPFGCLMLMRRIREYTRGA